MTNRSDPPFVGDETALLRSWLEFERRTLAWKCDGLDDGQLRSRAVAPSSMSLLGLVRHMTDVERHWCQRVLLGLDVEQRYWTDENPDADFTDVDDVVAAEALRTWREEMAATDAAVALDPSPDRLSAGRRKGAQVSLRWILVHLVQEYARHNGHADLLREQIDGATGE
jgi:uncharacterized damage-inducible protein DinB